MGAKVEVEGYNPGHCAMGDLHASANGWRFPYEEETSNGFVTAEAVGYSEYDKEMFRRTMLAHEAVFRQQVYELHRVYRVQRDLMKQHQSREMHECSTLEDASHRDSPSQIPLHGANMIGAAAVNNEKSQSSKFPREGSVQSSPNGFPSSDAALPTKQGRFDLELRADHCFEDDHASDSKPIDFLGVSSDTKHPKDAGVALARAEGLGRFGHNSATSFPPSTGNLVGHNHNVADLNKPTLGPYMARTNGTVSGGPSYALENSWQQSPWRSSTTNCSFNKEYSKDKRINEATSSNFFDASSRIKQEEKPLIDKGKRASSTGFLAPRCSGMDPQKMFSAADRGSASSNKFIYQCPNSSPGWFSGSPLEAYAINNLPGHDHLRYTSSTLVAPVTSLHMDQPSAASRVGSCIVDPRSYNISADVQSFPSFNGSSTVNSYACFTAANQSIGTPSCNLKKINNSDGSYSDVPLDSLSASQPRHQTRIPSDLEQNNKLMFGHPTRHCHEDPDFANGKGRKNFNLNEALSDGQEDIVVEQEGVCVGGLQHIKVEGSVSGISWLSKKASCADSTGLEEPRKVSEHSYGTAALININEDITGAALALCNLPDSASTSVGCGTKKDRSCDKIGARTQESAACLPLSCQKPMPRDGQAAEGVTNKSGAAVWNFIDLNEDAPNEDNSESSVVSSDCHVTSLQNNHAKPKFLIDLEVPACEDDDAATAAAESILVLSRDVPATAETPDDMLQWFAEVAISSTDYHAGQGEVQGCANNSSDDDPDSFESLTLKLEDIKTDELCSRPPAPAITTSDEHTVSPVNLLMKPKRGQQRKRRQKRDFQKDILPSISSLCRPEIIEDIQLLEGLVQTTGGSWESSLTRRRRTRGNKKPKKRVLDAVEEEVQVSVEEEEVQRDRIVAVALMGLMGSEAGADVVGLHLHDNVVACIEYTADINIFMALAA
ncbi:hypothetical protein TRIUR3_08831 [Triticum urartu]|uniref:Uncharacterized protein n=1 Tax=Triticum urartu TaxID=4572 RepID=M7YFB1_TRIUA|nr:hypothetical protein TRIUR3_08831 [Triticum urartu]